MSRIGAGTGAIEYGRDDVFGVVCGVGPDFGGDALCGHENGSWGHESVQVSSLGCARVFAGGCVSVRRRRDDAGRVLTCAWVVEDNQGIGVIDPLDLKTTTFIFPLAEDGLDVSGLELWRETGQGKNAGCERSRGMKHSWGTNGQERARGRGRGQGQSVWSVDEVGTKEWSRLLGTREVECHAGVVIVVSVRMEGRIGRNEANCMDAAAGGAGAVREA